MSEASQQVVAQTEQPAPSAPRMDKPEVYYDVGRKDYWIKDRRNDYIMINETSVKRHLRACGYSLKVRDGERLSDLETCLRRKTHGPIALWLCRSRRKGGGLVHAVLELARTLRCEDRPSQPVFARVPPQVGYPSCVVRHRRPMANPVERLSRYRGACALGSTRDGRCRKNSVGARAEHRRSGMAPRSARRRANSLCAA